MSNRLTVEVFRALLEKHPNFLLITGCWTETWGMPCGGCAMTLAFYDAHPGAEINKLGLEVIRPWADSQYGNFYVNGFIDEFDGPDPTDELIEAGDTAVHPSRLIGQQDGRECRALAFAMDRL